MLMGRKFPFLALLNRIEMFRKKELTSAEIEQKCIYICVRRRRTHTNRVVFTEITLEGFMDQS